MSGREKQGSVDSQDTEWSNVVQNLLPVHSPPWRLNRVIGADLPRQGWKLHVSATVLNAVSVLQRVAECLEGEQVYFKALGSRDALRKLNCGLFYGYAQIGKFITVYPTRESAIVAIADKIVRATEGMPGPDVPFEARVSHNSPVFTRYGLFRLDEGIDEAMLIAPTGSSEPDRRDENPKWASMPGGLQPSTPPTRPGPLATQFRAYKCLSQRGKGGVYRAIDLSVNPARHCILKEGRRHGEVDLDGSDGWSRLDVEHTALSCLSAAEIPVPLPYARFDEAGHAYLAMEWVPGEALGNFLSDKDAPLPIEVALNLARQAAGLLGRIHEEGWVWRDVKSTNFMIDPNGALRPIDFEGAAREGDDITSIWGSPGHMPRDVHRLRTASAGQDLYALGSLIYQILTGEALYGAETWVSDLNWKAIPADAAQLIKALWNDDADLRPSARSVEAALALLAGDPPAKLRNNPASTSSTAC